MFRFRCYSQLCEQRTPSRIICSIVHFGPQDLLSRIAELLPHHWKCGCRHSSFDLASLQPRAAPRPRGFLRSSRRGSAIIIQSVASPAFSSSPDYEQTQFNPPLLKNNIGTNLPLAFQKSSGFSPKQNGSPSASLQSDFHTIVLPPPSTMSENSKADHGVPDGAQTELADEVISGFQSLPIYRANEEIPGGSGKGVLSSKGLQAWRHSASGVRIVLFHAPGPLTSANIALGTIPVSDGGHPHTLEHIIFLGSRTCSIARIS